MKKLLIAMLALLVVSPVAYAEDHPAARGGAHPQQNWSGGSGGHGWNGGHGGERGGRGWGGDWIWPALIGGAIAYDLAYPYGYPYAYPYGYPYPVYEQPPVYVQPAPAYVAPPPPQAAQSVWYYCESAKGYYPYVPSCPEKWRMVPTTPPQ